MSLRDIFCQERAIESLQRAFGAGKLAHAYIFAGANGIGKFTTAREWAKVLLCHDRIKEDRTDGAFYDSCGNCRSCQLFEGQGHPDFKVIYKELSQFTKDGKNKTAPVNIPIDVIREFLIDKAATRPMAGESTVYIVREAEKLNPNSQNALLKVLEEPPAHCFIILLCSRLERLLATTRSRCQILRFSPVDEERIIDRLIEMGTARKEATYWARFSGGSMGTAMAWANLELEGQSCYGIKTELIGRLTRHQLSDSVAFAEWLIEAGKKISTAWSAESKNTSKKDLTRAAQKGLLQMMIAAFSDVMTLNTEGYDGVVVNSDQTGEIQALAHRFSAEEAAEKIDKASENIRWIERSVNEKLIFEELLLNYAACGRIIGS